ncbi:3489_t:CDS:1, partial [Dentiscutata erythropus]
MPLRRPHKSNLRNSYILKIQNRECKELLELTKEYRRRINAQARESELEKSKSNNVKLENSDNVKIEKKETPKL